MAKREPSQAKDKCPSVAVTDEDEAVRPLDLMRRRVGGSDAVTRASVLRDLEAAKHLAFDHANAASAVRATEAQGRIAGAFREPEPLNPRKLTDEELCAQLSGDDTVLAEILLAHLQRRGMPVRP